MNNPMEATTNLGSGGAPAFQVPANFKIIIHKENVDVYLHEKPDGCTILATVDDCFYCANSCKNKRDALQMTRQDLAEGGYRV